MRAAVSLPTVSIEDAAIVAAALELSERELDFADALHLRKAARCEGMASFDRKFVKAANAAGDGGIREA